MTNEHGKEFALEIFPAQMLDRLARQRLIEGGEQGEIDLLFRGPSLRDSLLAFLRQERPETPPDLAEVVVTAAIIVVVGRVSELLIARSV
jgi:hypothetical protein